MGKGKKRLEGALSKLIGDKADKLELVPASVGAYINGRKTVQVVDKPDYIWVRVRGTTEQRTQAFNSHPSGVGHHWDLPVLIYKDPAFPQIWKVYGRDIERYTDWEGVAYQVPHGRSHSFLGGSQKCGDDPVWVAREQITPLQPHPKPTGTCAIDISSDFYYFGGRYHWFTATGTIDLCASFLPTGGHHGKFVTVYLDGDTGNPAYLEGPEFDLILAPTDPGIYISVPTDEQGVPVAACLMTTGTTWVGWGELYDLRFIQSPVVATGSYVWIYDEGAIQGRVHSLNFEGDGIAAIVSGSFVHIVYTPPAASLGATMHWDDGSPLCTGTIIDWGNNLDVSCSGTVVRVDASGLGTEVLLKTAHSDAADAHTTDNTWEDIDSMVVLISPTQSCDIKSDITFECSPASVNWEHWAIRFVLNTGTFSENWERGKDANADQDWLKLFHCHTVFENVSAGTHQVKAQWWDRGSNMDLTFQSRRLTVTTIER